MDNSVTFVSTYTSAIDCFSVFVNHILIDNKLYTDEIKLIMCKKVLSWFTCYLHTTISFVCLSSRMSLIRSKTGSRKFISVWFETSITNKVFWLGL